MRARLEWHCRVAEWHCSVFQTRGSPILSCAHGVGVLAGWNANILTKFKKIGAKWSKLRAAQKRQAAKAAAQADVTPYTVSP